MNSAIETYHQWIDRLLREGRTVQVPVYGMSMFPVLMPRDVVQVQRMPAGAIRPGQIVVFEQEGRWVAHRLVQLDASTGFVHTRGDGLPSMDSPLPVENIKGVVIRVVRSRSPLARLINTRADKFLIRWGGATGPLFHWMGRLTVKLRGNFM